MNKFVRLIAAAVLPLVSGLALAGSIDIDNSKDLNGGVCGGGCLWQQSYTSNSSGILDGLAVFGSGNGTLSIHVNGAGESGYYSGAWDAVLDNVAVNGSVIDLLAYKLAVQAGQTVTFAITGADTLSAKTATVGALYLDLAFIGGGVLDYNQVGEYSLGFQSYVQTAAVPEPSTYGMLLAGLGLVGAATRRRRA